MERFSKKLEALIKEKGITYYQLAKESGVPKSTIHDYVINPKFIKLENVVKLANYFNISIDRLILDRDPIELQRCEVLHQSKIKQIKQLLDE